METQRPAVFNIHAASGSNNTQSDTPLVPAPPRLRLDYVDGLRGLAALCIVLHHTFQTLAFENRGHLPLRLVHLTNWDTLGHIRVDIFVVLSGFCLMLPVARAADRSIRGGLIDYFKRRARRILPPYYVALALSLLIIAAVPGMRAPQDVYWDISLPAFTNGVLLSHLLLIHNFRGDWFYKINYPLWTIATEWQLYFLFPLLLVLWRRLGMRKTILAAWILGVVPIFAWGHLVRSACPQFLGVFAFGMAGALASFSPHISQRSRTRPWGRFAAVLLGIAAVMVVFRPDWQDQHVWRTDVLIGAGVVCLLVSCARAAGAPEGSRRLHLPLRFLQSRLVVALGGISYSLYLVHAPILALVHLGLRQWPLTPLVMLGGLYALGVPAALAAAILFYHAFEKPFTRSPRPIIHTASAPSPPA